MQRNLPSKKDWGTLSYGELAEIQWNVTPLLGDFGGSVGICSFLWSPPSPWVVPSLSLILIVLSFLFSFRRVHARLQARGEAEGSRIVHALN